MPTDDTPQNPREALEGSRFPRLASIFLLRTDGDSHESSRRGDAPGGRAHRRSPTAPGYAPEPLDLQSERVQDLANEPFPLEMPERRLRPRPSASATTAVRQASAAIDVGHPPAAVHPVAPPGSQASATSLLERIDAPLAQKIVVRREHGGRRRASSTGGWRPRCTTQQADRGSKVVMIASAVPGEGKTLTASNLGLTFSESYQRSVLLIDADLRRPALHTVFGMDNTLRSRATGSRPRTERKLPARRISERLALLTGGQPNSDPMAGLTSERMRRLIHEARDAFDWVIIDTPPVAVLPDANLLSSMVDGAVLVVKAGSTPYDLVQRAIEAHRQGSDPRRRAQSRGGRPAAQLLRLRYYGDDRPDARRIPKAHDPTADASVHAAVHGAARVRDGAHRLGRRRGGVPAPRRRQRGSSCVDEGGVEKALLIAAVSQICLYYADLYDLRLVSDRRELFVRIVQALGAASFILAAIYFWFPALIIGRGVFMIAAFLVIALVIGWRVVFEWLSAAASGRASGCCSSAPAPPAVALAREMFERRHELGVEIVGFVDPDPAMRRRAGDQPRRDRHDRGHPVDRARPRRRSRRRQPGRRARQAADGQAARDEARWRVLRPSRVGLRGIHRQDRRREPATELADLLAGIQEEPDPDPAQAADGSVIAACRDGDGVADHGSRRPCGGITSPGPALYSQRRVGQHGRVFTVHKFRSMRQDAEALTGPVWATTGNLSRPAAISRLDDAGHRQLRQPRQVDDFRRRQRVELERRDSAP